MDAHQPVTTSRTGQRGFSITELLVVIGIIVLLAGLLIVAMGRVRETSLRTSTISTMQSFARACEAFQTEHGFYPGVIPEQILAQANANGQVNVLRASGSNVSVGPSSLSSTENALLHLMGGFAVRPPGTPDGSPAAKHYSGFIPDADFSTGKAPGKLELEIGAAPSTWLIKIDTNRIGAGPIINGKPYAPYFTPGPRELAVTPGQVRQTDNTNPGTWHVIPDLIDAWGQPILYTRQVREHGPLVGPHDATGGNRPQFVIEGMAPYFEATMGSPPGSVMGLGERSTDQATFSLLAVTSESAGVEVNRYSTFAQIIRHPSFGDWAKSPLSPENRGRVVARGAYVLISAGPDGIYFSRHDGPGTPGNPVDDIVTTTGGHNNPQAVDSYDDIVIFGGG